MANLVITVIAIALVALASLMGAYYGGAAFLNSSEGAIASTVLNQGNQLTGAWQAYLQDNYNTPPTNDVGVLTTLNYVRNWPQYPATTGGLAQGPYGIVSANGHFYAVAVVGTQVTNAVSDPAAGACVRIVKAASGSMPTALPQLDFPTMVQGGANIGTTQFGCGAIAYTGGFTVLPNSTANFNPPIFGTTYTCYFLLS